MCGAILKAKRDDKKQVESSNLVSGGGLTLGGSRQIKLSISHFGFLPVVY